MQFVTKKKIKEVGNKAQRNINCDVLIEPLKASSLKLPTMLSVFSDSVNLPQR